MIIVCKKRSIIIDYIKNSDLTSIYSLIYLNINTALALNTFKSLIDININISYMKYALF